MPPLHILLTGGTGGIGEGIARGLAQAGARLIVTGRNQERGEKFAFDLCQLGGTVSFLPADLSDQRGTVALAQAYTRLRLPLDVLINNVGGVWPERQLTPEGLEKTLAINHVHPFLLSACLFPLLKASRGKVVHQSTGYHELVTLTKQDWEQKRFDAGMNVYGRSKKISLLAGLYQAWLWQREGVGLQFADPGMAWTPLTSQMGREYFPWYGRFLVPSIHALQKKIPLAWAAGPAVQLALHPEDQRPGVYAFPPGFRLRLKPSKTGRLRGRLFLAMTRERWFTAESRDALKAAFAGEW